MYYPRSILFVILFALSAAVCNKKKAPTEGAAFLATPVGVPVLPGFADEASGLTYSTSTPGSLWLEEDSGNPTQVQLVSASGAIARKVFIADSENRDWEDMAIAPDPVSRAPYLYVADIGDNNAQHNDYTIYRFPEPGAAIDTVRAPEKRRFQYPDGAHDAEAILVDPLTGDIFVVTKRDAAARVYQVRPAQNGASIATAEFITTLSFTGVVGGAVSVRGNEILLKTYGSVYYWSRESAESIGSALKRAPLSLAYKVEPQGEAISFAADDSGFFTLSERGGAASVSLNFYKRR